MQKQVDNKPIQAEQIHRPKSEFISTQLINSSTVQNNLDRDRSSKHSNPSIFDQPTSDDAKLLAVPSAFDIKIAGSLSKIESSKIWRP